MARRYHEIKGLAEFTAKMIVSDEEAWKKFLHIEIRAIKSEQEIISEFRAKTEELFDPKPLDGMSPATIEEAVREKVLQIAEDYGLDVTVEDVIVSGSRCRGLEKAESDLDVVVSFSGNEREDDFFNILHDEKIYFGSVELDINPISMAQTGTLAQYLPGVEDYLAEKAAVIEQNEDIAVGNEPEHETSGQNVQKSEQEAEPPAPLTAEQLAMEIDQFAYETDTYEYKDTVDDREANIRGIAESIETGQDGGARAYLTSFVEESEDPETVTQAKELLKKLDEYKPLAKVEEMVEQNYNMIDNVINNLPQDPEEKKEPAPQKEMRTAEVKKVRTGISGASISWQICAVSDAPYRRMRR